MYGRFGGGVLVGVMLSSVAYGSLDKEVAACAARKGDLERLECYDALARKNKLDAPVASPAPVSGVGKWDVQDERNPIDDTRTVVLRLAADSGTNKWNKPIALYIRCKSNQTEMYIAWNDYLGMDTSRVVTRVGTLKAETKSWQNSTDNQATFYPGSPIGAIKTMMQHEAFVAQVTPYNESPVTATFDLRGLTNAITPLRETCKW